MYYPNQYQPQMIYPQSPSRSSLSGKIVGDFNEVNITDIPMDGSVSVFVKNDLSEIQVRHWNSNGTINSITFANTANKQPVITEPSNSTPNTLETGIGANLELTEAFKQEITDRFDRLENLLSEKQPRKEKESGKNE